MLWDKRASWLTGTRTEQSIAHSREECIGRREQACRLVWFLQHQMPKVVSILCCWPALDSSNDCHTTHLAVPPVPPATEATAGPEHGVLLLLPAACVYTPEQSLH